MMIFILSLLAILAVCLYIGGVFVAGEKIQNWCLADGWPPVLIPWVFAMMMLIGLPASLALALAYG